MYMHIKNEEGLLKRKLSVFKICVTKQITTKVRKYISELELVEGDYRSIFTELKFSRK